MAVEVSSKFKAVVKTASNALSLAVKAQEWLTKEKKRIHVPENKITSWTQVKCPHEWFQ